VSAGPSAADGDVRLLIVDDQPRNLDALEVMLQPLGCTLVRAQSADEALLALLRDDFGALILDIKMPGMSGIELASLVKQRNRSKDVPILFLTAHAAEEDDVLRAYGVGGVDYLSKPVKADVLRSKVAVFVDLYRKTRALSMVNDELTHQIAERERAERTLLELNSELELRVVERTAALAAANKHVLENEERLRMAVQLAMIGPWEWDTRPESAGATAMPGRSGWSWNLHSRPLRWTRELEQLWELGPGQTTYEDFEALIHPSDRIVVEATRDTALRNRQPFEVEFRIVLPSGAVRWVYSKGGAVYDADGRPVRVLGNDMDITERKRAEEALREVDRHRSEFLAILAHELRNPLAPIRTAAEVLRQSPADDQRGKLEAIEAIVRQVGQMTILIDDLLDESRIAQGKIALRPADVDVTDVVRQTVSACQPLFDDGGIELDVTYPSRPVVTRCDQTRLAQVIQNLLSNAAKFTPSGGRVRLTVELANDQAIIRVTDNGIGIGRDDLPRVFDRFVQLDTSLERAQGGLGLGLSLVKTLVELHGGTVVAHSGGVGHGAEFVVTLPAPPQAVRVKETVQAPSPPRSAAATAQKKRILVVDDNRDSATAMAMLLGIGGHETRVAHDGVEAVTTAEQFGPEIVLLDLGLPKLNGYEVALRLRAMPGGAAMVIAALTGWGQDSDRQRTTQSGFDVHLVKPVDPAVLLELVGAARPR